MCPNPRVLMVGPWLWPWYQEICAKALQKAGCQTEKFGYIETFFRWVPDRPEPVVRSFFHRVQYRFLAGPHVYQVNLRLLKKARVFQPDIIFLYNATHLLPETIKKLKEEFPNACLVQYCNDNPFSRNADRLFFRHLIRSIPDFDLHFVFRKSNIEQFRQAGGKSVHLLRAYFIPEEEYPVALTAGDERFHADVVFAGHYENDGRLVFLEEIARRGFSLNIFGGGWVNAVSRLAPDSPLKKNFPIQPVLGSDYRKAICGAKIALCFLSKLNEDTYTRRTFQIPAMRGCMLAEYSDDQAGLFKEGREIAFFRSKEDCLEKISFYLTHEDDRRQIAQKGCERVWADQHDVYSRMKQALSQIQEVKKCF